MILKDKARKVSWGGSSFTIWCLLLHLADAMGSCPAPVPVVSPACSVDALGEVLDAFAADVPLHFG